MSVRTPSQEAKMFYDCTRCETTLELAEDSDCPICGGEPSPSLLAFGPALHAEPVDDEIEGLREHWFTEGWYSPTPIGTDSRRA